MDLKTFIAETVTQIVAGVREAQKGEAGGLVNAEGIAVIGGHLINCYSAGIFTRVDFDVAVTAETAVGGKAGIRVAIFSAEGGGDLRHSTANRVTFSIPVRLPEGAKRPRP